MITNYMNYDALFKLAESTFKFVIDNNVEGHIRTATDLYSSESANSVRDAKLEVIKNAADLSSKEKIEYLNAIDEQEFEHKLKCVELADISAEKRADTVIKVIDRLMLVATAGYCVFEVASGIQNYTGQLQIVPKSTR